MTKDQKVGIAMIAFIALVVFIAMSMSIGFPTATLITTSAITFTGLIFVAASLLSGQITLKDLAVWIKLKENQDVGDNT